MKTKEDLAEEYADERVKVVVPDAEITFTAEDLNMFCQVDFIAGYEAATNWISVQDEPIPLNILCNVVDVKGRVFNCSFKTENDMRFGINFYKITHYFPIPKLPTK